MAPATAHTVAGRDADAVVRDLPAVSVQVGDGGAAVSADGPG
ncbi:hypothetical protein AB0I68_33715 [Streptomyces sp. NPDC050448]